MEVKHGTIAYGPHKYSTTEPSSEESCSSGFNLIEFLLPISPFVWSRKSQRTPSMATLTMQPIDPVLAAQEGSSGGNKLAEDGGDMGDIDAGWVFLGKSDIVPADLAAAAAVRGGLRSSSAIPTWARWALGGVVFTVVPFYNRVRNIEEEAVGYVDTAVEAVEHIAEVTEKLAANVADQLPEDGSLQKAVEEVEYIADIVDKDAEKVKLLLRRLTTSATRLMLK